MQGKRIRTARDSVRDVLGDVWDGLGEEPEVGEGRAQGGTGGRKVRKGREDGMTWLSLKN